MLLLLMVLLLPWLSHSAAPDPLWPNREAEMVLRVIKKAGFELEKEPQWMHLHIDTSNPAAQTLTLTIQVLLNGYGYSGDDNLTASNIQVRYVVMGIPISRWLSPGAWDLTLTATSAALFHVKDGVLDISLEVSGPDRMLYKPWPAFLHLKRNQPLSPLVPLMIGDHPNMASHWIPDVVRIDRNDRLTPVTAQNDGKVTTTTPRAKVFPASAASGFPANPSLSPWSDPPTSKDNLYVETLTPGGALFEEQQMWWEDLPSHPGLHFVRGLQPYQGEDPRGVDHRPLPVQDGPRGHGWMSGYVAGHVDRRGRLAFAELAGRVGWLLPDGGIVTLAGWVTSPGFNPVWVRKDLAVVRRNQQLRGQGPSFEGFGKPMDVAFDPDAPDVLYVPDLAQHCVWKVEVLGWQQDVAGSVPQVRVSLLAGSDSAESGFADGVGTAARFNEPFSAAWVRGAAGGAGVLYVSDSANHAVRRISLPDGSVTTVWGGPGVVDRITSAGIDPFERAALRTTLRVAVSPTEAAAGRRPDVYWPSVIRADSQGNLILLEHGFGQIRRLSPTDNSAVVLATVDQKFGEYDHGWAWLDVDTTGSAGPVDGIYWCKAVGDNVDGEEGYHFNEVFAWLPKEGGGSRFLFPGRGGGANPIGLGERTGTTPPHYPWLVAVDPRGGLLLTGMGVHGVSRLRLRDTGAASRDPTATEDWLYFQGQELYRAVGSLCLRYGFGAHNLLQLGLDGWATQGLRDNPAALLDYYSVPPSIANDTYATTNLLIYLSKQTGPARDGIPTAPPDTQPPTAPVLTAMAAGTFYSPSSIILKWSLAQDDRAVDGYELQLVRGPNPVFAAANAVPGYFGVAVGNTEVLLAEGLRRGIRYHARLRAVDLGGRAGAWSAVRTLRLP